MYDITSKTKTLEDRINVYLLPNDKNMHKIFMPLSQYPKIYGLKVSEIYKEIIAEDVISFNFEFVVENKELYDIEVVIGEFKLKLVKKVTDKRGKVFNREVQIASLPSQEHFILCFRIIDSKLYLAINERRITCLKEGISAFKIDWFSIKVKAGSIFVLSQQFYDIKWNLQVKEFYYINEKVSKEIYNTSPKYVLLWERRTKEIYQTLLLAYDLVSNEQIIDEQLKLRVISFADLIYKMFTAWPKWRPSSHSELGTGVWETNNWCNGYLPGAYALVTKLLKKESFDDFYEKGLNWLVDKRNVQDVRIIDKFPPVVHWMNRSTNHGIVILATILVGACILNIFKDERVQLLYNDLKEIINKAFEDGSYLESVSYFQFVISELIPLFYHLSKLSSLSYVQITNSDFKTLPLSIDFVNAVSNHSTGKYYAMYGDCEPSHEWFATVLLFIVQINNKRKKLDFYFDFTQYNKELYSQFLAPPNKEFEHLEFFKDSNTSCKIFKSNSFIQVKHSNLYNESEFYIWINGSKLHKTHNKDNDLGSFYLSDDTGEIFIKKRGVDIRNHNVVIVKKVMIDGKPVSAEEIEIHEYKFPRKINGKIEIIEDNDELYIFKHSASLYFKVQSNSLIDEHIRFYIVLKKSSFNLIIVDMINSSYDLMCEAILNVSNKHSFSWDPASNKVENQRLCVSSIGNKITLNSDYISNKSFNFSKKNKLITFIRSKCSDIDEIHINTILENYKIY